MASKTTIFLVASLCLNAALMGGVAAGYYAIQKPEKVETKKTYVRRGDRPPPSRQFDETLAKALFHKLDGEEKAAFREALAKEWHKSGSELDSQLKFRDELSTILLQEKLDRQAAEDAFNKIQLSSTTLRARLYVLLLDALEAMDPQERIQLIKDLQDQNKQRREKLEEIQKNFREGKGPPPPPEKFDGPPPPPPEDFDGPPPPPPKDD